MTYPKWIYSKDKQSKIVHSKEEHEAHKGWEETPAAFPQEQIEETQEPKADQTETSEAPKTYKEHMSEWVSESEKKEKKTRKKKAE